MAHEAPAILLKIIDKHEAIFVHEHLRTLNRKRGQLISAERRTDEIRRLKYEIREDVTILRRLAKGDGFRAASSKLKFAEDISRVLRGEKG